MGRKLNVSTPTVINTELVPLSESFYIEADGNLEQWYYENDDRYAPNRKVTPMTLTPCISAFDADTQQTYTPSFYTVRWFEQAWDSTQGAYVETEITNTVDSLSADYVKVGDTLLVKKNVGYTHSVTITCKAQYIDPRDSGITYNISDSVLLTTNRDATVVTPELDVDCPSSQAFNPLVDDEIVNGNLQYKSEFTMKASSDYSSVLATNVAQYKVDPLGTEEVIPTNETAVVTSAPTMDIRYGDYEQTNQKFMRRQTSGGQIPYIAGNMAYVNKIKGNTVKYAQIYKNMRSNFTLAGVSYSTVDKYSFTYSGTATKKDNVTMPFSCISGHKYYFACREAEDGFYYSEVTGGSGSYITNTKAFIRIPSAKTMQFGVAFASGKTYTTAVVYKPMIIDLTALGIDSFTTPDQVEEWMTNNWTASLGISSYYPYNAGELIPVKMSAIKSVGFNIWDEEWEVGGISTSNGQNVSGQSTFRSKNLIPVFQGETYYYKGNSIQYIYGRMYDACKNYIGNSGIGLIQKNTTFTIPTGCSYIRFVADGTTYNNDICINISDASRNGTYEAHWEAEQYLPITELKGKVNGQGDSVVIFPNGMNHVGDVYDEIKVEDGVIKAIKRFGRVNLGDSNAAWYGQTGQGDTYYRMMCETYKDLIKKPNSSSAVAKVVCPKYVTYNADSIYRYTTGISIGTLGRIEIYDPNYNQSDSATAFKTAMDGVYLVYELATPVEYIIDNMPRGQFEWYGISNNAEVLVETLPWYKSGQHTDTLVVDAMYGEEIRVVLRSRVSAGSDRLYPNKVYRSIVWQIPNVDTNTVSKNGEAVRSNTTEMEFETIVNVKGAVLTEQLKDDNLRFNWKIRKSNVSTETDKGWGKKKVIPASELRNVIGSSSSLASTFVLPYVYLLGAREAVVDNNEEVTDNGEVVYDRPVF